jgi:diguanylate cyclase (GGDEF)-like protein
VVDLDDLKSINDELGHQAGDARIVALAHALLSVATARHRLARIGGDEFVILANGVAANAAEAHFTRFTQAIADAGIQASFGCSTGRADDIRMQGALHEADARMYQQKTTRK